MVVELEETPMPEAQSPDTLSVGIAASEDMLVAEEDRLSSTPHSLKEEDFRSRLVPEVDSSTPKKPREEPESEDAPLETEAGE